MTPDGSPNDENAGHGAGQELEITLASYLKPTIEVYDFDYTFSPRLDEQTRELIGGELTLRHASWPLSVRLLIGRLTLVELATGILAVVDSHDQARGGE